MTNLFLNVITVLLSQLACVCFLLRHRNRSRKQRGEETMVERRSNRDIDRDSWLGLLQERVSSNLGLSMHSPVSFDTHSRRFVLKKALSFAPGLAGLLPERHGFISKVSSCSSDLVCCLTFYI